MQASVGLRIKNGYLKPAGTLNQKCFPSAFGMLNIITYIGSYVCSQIVSVRWRIEVTQNGKQLRFIDRCHGVPILSKYIRFRP